MSTSILLTVYMSRVYHVHNSSRPVWELLDKKQTPHPRLVGQQDYNNKFGIKIYHLNIGQP